MFRYNEDSAESSILVWLREYMGQLSSSRRYLLDLLLALAWWYISCSTFQDFLLTAQIMIGRIAIFHVLTTFLHSFLLHLFRLKLCSSCCSDCIYWLQQLYSGSMTETYRVPLHYLVKLSLTGVRSTVSTFALSSRNGATVSLLLYFRIISSDCDTVMRVDFDIEDTW